MGQFTHPTCTSTCTLDGVTTNADETHSFCTTTSAPCNCTSRICQSDGTYSGDPSFKYKTESCISSLSSATTCTDPHGQTVNVGQTLTLYLAPVGHPTCVSDVITCLPTGQFSHPSSYTFTTCSPMTGGGSCSKPGQLEWVPGDHKVEWCNNSGTLQDATVSQIGTCPATDKGKISIGATLQYCDDSGKLFSMKGPVATPSACQPNAKNNAIYYYSNQLYFCSGGTAYKVGN
jgi:hypothetical protein